MGNKGLLYALSAIFLIVGLAFIGCSDDDSAATPTGSGDTGGTGDAMIGFTEYQEIVQQVVPAAFSAPSTAPGAIDPIWNGGDYPLLGKVLSPAGEEPMSLYSNVERLDMVVEEVAFMLAMNDSTGWVEDSSWAELIELTAPVAIPTAYQSALGMSSVELDHVLKAQFPGDTGVSSNHTSHIGFTSNDTVQTVLLYEKMLYDGNWDSFLFYAYVNLVDSTLDIRGLFYKVEEDAAWAYQIQTVGETDFGYRMSWHADCPDFSLLGCILGGGNKDEEFALRYREFNPADSVAYRAEAEAQQVFDASYAEGTGLISSYSDYLNEDLFYTYDQIPLSLLVSPFDE
ncbi:MAG: hypothetical protein GY867_09290 [bacterium]|nr:hypothetical protein [bacterium]